METMVARNAYLVLLDPDAAGSPLMGQVAVLKFVEPSEDDSEYPSDLKKKEGGEEEGFQRSELEDYMYACLDGEGEDESVGGGSGSGSPSSGPPSGRIRRRKAPPRNRRRPPAPTEEDDTEATSSSSGMDEDEQAIMEDVEFI